jgi:hypothetical protein
MRGDCLLNFRSIDCSKKSETPPPNKFQKGENSITPPKINFNF